MFHRTERLLLRPAWPEDWEPLYRGIADCGIVRNLATAPWPYTPDDARAFVGLKQDPRFPHFLLTMPGTHGSTVIGAAGMGPRGDGVELGYWIARPFWGQGFATEGARGVIELARLIGYHRIEASHYCDNPASGRVLRKLGFLPTGKNVRHDCLARGEAVEAVAYRLDLTQEDAPPAQAA